MIILSVFEIVGSPLCVASDDGEKVHERIRKAIRQGRSVALSFMNITNLTPAFLNLAIGQPLYFPKKRSERNLPLKI
jgi:hypothetical protein